jgi:hypothetical protein
LEFRYGVVDNSDPFRLYPGLYPGIAHEIRHGDEMSDAKAQLLGVAKIRRVVEMTHDGTPRPLGDRLRPEYMFKSIEPENIRVSSTSPPRRFHETGETPYGVASI